ncbi:fatty acid desaturase family protein [Micromonospora sp. NPDC049275]|uniref:fatty acid desaturase family protein n=1 Tax=Micromonospora sp. NPDC049275 TaxID=3364268 RepID=UPI00372321FA
MSASKWTVAPHQIFQRCRVDRRDQAAFVGKLAIAAMLGVIGVALVVTATTIGLVTGIVLLGALYTHLVELQHQCLHHSAFVAPGRHRPVGVLLGLPLLVSYSHYRVRHLQHHRFLGTDRDSEFFGFDTRQPLTVRTLLGGLFDFRRLLSVAVQCYRSWRGTWRYDDGQSSERIRRDSMVEYRLISLLVLAAGVAALAGYGMLVVQLWLAPLLLVAIPLHFLVELPEHVRCDNDTTDVLRNTRSISGSRFTTWYTNGNNLHVEHHAAMTVPINRLPERHGEVRLLGKYVDHSYWSFYRQVLREVVANSRRPSRRRLDEIS